MSKHEKNFMQNMQVFFDSQTFFFVFAIAALLCLACCCSIWNNFTSCVANSRCTLDDVYQYRLSLGYWYSFYQQRYNSTIATYKFICSQTEGAVYLTFLLLHACRLAAH